MRPTPWWRWTGATFIIVCAWLFLAAVVSALTKAVLPGGPSWAVLLTDLSTFIPFLLATPLAWRYLLGNGLAMLVNVRGKVLVGRIGVGFGFWFALSALTTLLDAIINPGNYEYTFSLVAFVPFALVTVLLLPVQVGAEELFFRGWILRWASALPPVSQVVISGLVFALPHMGNPEASTDAQLALVAYFLLGAGWAYVSVRSGGIELAMGAHLANNAFSLLVVGYANAALPTSAIFTTRSLDLVTTVISLALMMPVFAYLTRRHSTMSGSEGASATSSS